MGADVLTERQLNRATLARQLLLERADLAPYDAVEHLVGMQAQVPLDPYLALWSRLAGFSPTELGQLILDRRLVRIVVMRATLHLVTADDCLVLRPLAQPVLDKELARHRDYGPALRDVDLEPVLAYARALLAERPRTGRELRTAMAERFPDDDAAALAYACRNRLAFIQVPPRGVWGRTAQVTSTTAEAWLGRSPAENPSVDHVALRYLAAFGPASVADMGTWSRFTGLRPVFERLRPQLQTFRDHRGRELFDLPEAPRPDADTPAPPRFLPEYDNLLLSHADRTRFISEEDRTRPSAPRPIQGSVLYDGRLCGTWRFELGDDRERLTLVIDHLAWLPKKATAELTPEGLKMVRFLELESRTVDVRFAAIS